MDRLVRCASALRDYSFIRVCRNAGFQYMRQLIHFVNR